MENDNAQLMLGVYIKKIGYNNDKRRNDYRYILFDYDTGIPYLYASDREHVMKLYMEPIDGCTITANTIDRYTERNKYTKTLEMIRMNHSDPVLKQYSKMDDIKRFGVDLRFISSYMQFADCNKNIISAINKLSQLISTL